MSALRDIFLPDAPFAGSVDAKAHISGDLHAPALSDVYLTVDDGDRFRLTLGGSITDLEKRKGLDRRVDAVSQDSAVTRYLIRDAIPTVQTIRLRGGVQGSAGDYDLQDLEAEVSGKNDLSVSARGSIHLAALKSEWPLEEAQLDLHVSAATADLETWLPQVVPKTGALRLKAHIGGSTDALVFQNLDIKLEKTRPIRGTIKEFTTDGEKRPCIARETSRR